MTAAEFVGCACIAYGPLFSMFVLTIVNDPIRIIVLVASGFFWLCSFLTSSIILFPVNPEDYLLAGVIISVIFQEGFRYLIYLLLKTAGEGLRRVTLPNTNLEIVDNRHILAYVAGLGFGLMSGVFSLVNLLADISGPGTVGLTSSSNPNYFSITSSLLTMCFVLLHTFWSVIFFSAIDNKNGLQLFWVLASHMLVSCLTILNKKSLYYATICPAFFVLLCSGIIAFQISGGSARSLKNGLFCGQKVIVSESSTSNDN